jgi:glutamate synthase (NADPH/NADH) small chain
LDWRKARPLEVPGSELAGVIQAVPFLLQKKTPIELQFPEINIAGKRVTVLGGGDTAMDCVRAAIRHGASEAVCVYRREESEMPCTHQEFQNAIEEGAQFVFRAAPVAVLGTGGTVTGLRLIRTEPGPIDSNGRQSFRYRPGTEFVMETDWVIPALGFNSLSVPPGPELAGLAQNEVGAVMVDEKQMTSLPGVFAAGDLVNGPTALLHAVREARSAARNIHSYLAAQPAKA